jgi:hypothetical protein
MARKTEAAELALEDPAQSFDTPAINQMLWNRYTEKGEYVFLFDVPDCVGTSSNRRCDGVAIGMWGSTGRLIHGFEVKMSRSDWLRELKDVTKADPFLERCDRWWLVTGHAAVAKAEEVPAAWGWMVATKSGLRIQRPAAPLPVPSDLRRVWALALIRRAADRGDPNSEEFRVMLQNATAQIERREKQRADAAIAQANPAHERLRLKVEKFEADSGMKMEDWQLGNVGRLARRLAALNNHGYSDVAKTLERMAKDLGELRDKAKAVIQAIDCPALLGEDDDDA